MKEKGERQKENEHQKHYQWFRSGQSMKCLKRTSLHWNQILRCTFVIYSLELKSMLRYVSPRQVFWLPARSFVLFMEASVNYDHGRHPIWLRCFIFFYYWGNTRRRVFFLENSIWLLLSHLKHMLIKNKCVQSFFKELQYLFLILGLK